MVPAETTVHRLREDELPANSKEITSAIQKSYLNCAIIRNYPPPHPVQKVNNSHLKKPSSIVVVLANKRFYHYLNNGGSLNHKSAEYKKHCIQCTFCITKMNAYVACCL